MNKHDNIYNILSKLASLEPTPAKPQSVLKELNESAKAEPSVAQRLNEKYMGFKKTVAAEKKLGEEKTMSRAAKGNEKYGKDGMKELAKAGRDGASEKELDKIRDKHNKYDEGVDNSDNSDEYEQDPSGQWRKKVQPGKTLGSRIAAGVTNMKRDAEKFVANKTGMNLLRGPLDEQNYNEDMLAKKDYDGDGKKESGKAEYLGSRDKAIKKAMGKSKEEGNEFSGNRQDAIDAGQDSFEVDGKKYPVKESDVVPGKSWIKHPDDPDSKIPAYRRKETEPSRQASQASADAANAKVGAKVFRAANTPRPSDVEDQYNEDDAHSSLPGVRKTTKKEHGEYDTAAHTVRKWMRKRGWNTHEEFKPALKYIMDNLEDAHDDSLTDEVKEAAQVCEKYHATMVEGGLDMNLIKSAQGGMAGANTDPESERNRAKPYGSRTDAAQDSDDDYDEWGNLKKGAKKTAPAADGPKKRGRPRKNFGPVRTTAKAWKHKGKRVAESINLETYVDDVMEELEAMFIVEKAKSKAQQKFMGMVYAAKKGEKPASKEVAKVAKGMSKKDAEDFAKTKHKGLPDKVTEGVNFAELMKETGQTVEEMLTELNMEMEEFRRSGRLGDKLRDALDLHRHGKKLMDTAMAPPASMAAEDSLDELALLAGLHGGQKQLDKNKDGKLTAMDFEILRGEKKSVDESGCNMTAEGVYCEVHGMNECGTMYEDKISSGDKINKLDEGDIDPNRHPQTRDYGNSIHLQADDGEHYDRADDFFSRFEADHFDREEESDDGMEVRGYIDGVNVMVWRFDDESKTSGYGHYDDDELKDFDSVGESGYNPLDDERREQRYMDQERERFKRDELEAELGHEDLPFSPDPANKPPSAIPGKYGIGPSTAKHLAKQGMKSAMSDNKNKIDECGMAMDAMDQQDGMSVNTSMDTKTGRKTVTVTADGDAAEELARILKMAGMIGAAKQDHSLDEYANEPDEVYGTTDAIIRQGNDLNRPKSQHADKAKLGDNPLATMESRLNALYKALKQEK